MWYGLFHILFHCDTDIIIVPMPCNPAFGIPDWVMISKKKVFDTSGRLDIIACCIIHRMKDVNAADQSFVDILDLFIIWIFSYLSVWRDTFTQKAS